MPIAYRRSVLALFDLDNTLIDRRGGLEDWARDFVRSRRLLPEAESHICERLASTHRGSTAKRSWQRHKSRTLRIRNPPLIVRAVEHVARQRHRFGTDRLDQADEYVVAVWHVLTGGGLQGCCHLRRRSRLKLLGDPLVRPSRERQVLSMEYTNCANLGLS